MIKAEIIQDSINPAGNRLTTFILEYPRFVHAEFLTHRAFSRNAASSRAIPIEKMIQQVLDNPAMPVWWGKNQSGMQANEELDSAGKFHAEETWLLARDQAIEHVKTLSSIGLHKQIANRLLEPWFNIRLIVSATDYENFFALRYHEDAQPEIRALAKLMLEVYNDSTPKFLKFGDWHIPFGDSMDESKLNGLFDDGSGVVHMTIQEFQEQKDEYKKKIAVARCARISYLNYQGKDDYATDIKLCDRLFKSNPKHLSPTEHVAQALDTSEPSGNFVGFKQFRKFFQDENLKDTRVRKHI